MRLCLVVGFPGSLGVYSESNACSPRTRSIRRDQRVGICAAPEAGVAGAAGTVLPGMAEGAVVAGIWAAAPEAAGAGAGAAAGAAARSSTEPDSGVRPLPK